jgi:predicted RNA-binding protein with PUA-like domain
MKMQPLFFARRGRNRSSAMRNCMLHYMLPHKSDASLHTTWRQQRRMHYWLMKSEPEDVSIDDALAAPDHTVAWTGVRNYQARNFMRDAMQIGDGVLFYHSGCAEPGIAGIAEVASTAYPDPTQFDPSSKYHDPKSRPEEPRWMLVNVKALRRTRYIGLAEMRAHPDLADMILLKRGNRLSITPVTAAEWRTICKLAAR